MGDDRFMILILVSAILKYIVLLVPNLIVIMFIITYKFHYQLL